MQGILVTGVGRRVVSATRTGGRGRHPRGSSGGMRCPPPSAGVGPGGPGPPGGALCLTAAEVLGPAARHPRVAASVNTGLVIAAGGFAGSGWRLAGWGLGLAVHTAYVVGDLGRVQERLVQRELDRERGR